MGQLGSSPLGLVMNTKSVPEIKLGSYVVGESDNGRQLYNSLFGRNGDDVSRYQFDFNKDDKELFDITTEEIITFCQRYPLMRLSYSDFAYLKDLGVYPNNRLIIARRFSGPIGDDLVNNTENNTFPLATMVSWVKDNEDFLDITFGEKWIEGDTSFEDLLNEASKNTDIMGGDNKGAEIGTKLAGGLSLVPLPGFTEGLQYELFRKLGLTDLKASDLPFGNPNLIRQSKRRATAGKDEAFSGVTAKVSVKFEVEYEQKFISGIDPTGVYYDIIANALSFGTSVSKFMFKPETLGANNQFQKFLNDLGSGDTARVSSALWTFANTIGDALQALAKSIAETVAGLWQGKSADDKQKENAKEGNEDVDYLSSATNAVESTIGQLISNIMAGVISKYKVRVISIIDSLTGSPSAPWHVTIGNPKRPILSSGDMYVDSVDVKFGKLLAFNDLPSSIKVSFTLTNARDLGAQEIYRKMNCGRERSYKLIRKDILDVDGELNIPTKPINGQETSSNNSNNTGNGGGGSDNAPIDNSSRSNETRKKDEGTNSCFKNYNFIIDEIKRVLEEKNDTYGSENGKKVPLLKQFSSRVFLDNVVGAENAVRVTLVKEILGNVYKNATACPDVKTRLDSNLSKIYAGILNRSDSVQVDYFSNPLTGVLSKKYIDTDY